MKIVFFRQLLVDEVTRKWTSAQQMVYSHLLSQSILRLDCVFEIDGMTINQEAIEVSIDDDGQIDMADYKVDSISELLNLSKQTVYDSILFLRRLNYITDIFITCRLDIVNHGYFELLTDTGLTKGLLVFYSWLHDKSVAYGGIIDAFSYKLGETFGEKDTNIRMMLSRLAEKGYVKRIKSEDKRYGKLIIY